VLFVAAWEVIARPDRTGKIVISARSVFLCALNNFRIIVPLVKWRFNINGYSAPREYLGSIFSSLDMLYSYVYLYLEGVSRSTKISARPLIWVLR
jgi:hypothetical protein